MNQEKFVICIKKGFMPSKRRAISTLDKCLSVIQGKQRRATYLQVDVDKIKFSDDESHWAIHVPFVTAYDLNAININRCFDWSNVHYKLKDELGALNTDAIVLKIYTFGNNGRGRLSADVDLREFSRCD